MEKVLLLIFFIPTLIFCQVDNGSIEQSRKVKENDMVVIDLIANLTVMD